ncbi:large conductance mechanosensitive channel protein MscL [uncultured Corynebacterium sp.]|uniref:large conductance mechanosensitive channel protein MscL n=1 Tax=uncultured Corynebacterium sp. TaxID=159447 RepID=UPI0025D69FFC|nr:large conductance mechanosensitive channel protein MscL [uncultured Corynebacterium sp.]
MLQGFKEFILRGNVIELATAVIIGSAFTAIVTAISDSFISPLIALFGGANVNGFAYTLREGNEATTMDFGAIITAIINFLIVAAVVYFIIIMPMNKYNEMVARRKGIDTDPEVPAPTAEELLVEIRDLLEKQNGSASTGNHSV